MADLGVGVTKGMQWRTWIHYHYFLSRAILVGGASVLLILIGIFPMVGRLKASRQILDKERVRLEELGGRVVVLDSLDERILEQRLKLVNRVLPPSKDVIAYLVTLDAMARELDLSLGDVYLSPGLVYEAKDKNAGKKPTTGNNESWQILGTEMRVIGSQDNIYSFLKKVEKVAPLMVIRDIKVGRVLGQDGGSFVLNLKLGMVYAEPSLAKIKSNKISLLTNEDEKVIQFIEGLKVYPRTSEVGAVTLDDEVSGEKRDLFSPSGVRWQDQSDLPPDQQETPELELETPEESSPGADLQQ